METNPTSPAPPAIRSDSSPADLQRKKKFWERAIWCSGALFLITPMVGVLVTVIGMRNAFAALGSDGVQDPAALSAHIGDVLVATACGMIIWLPNLTFLIISIIRFLSCRAKLRALPS